VPSVLRTVTSNWKLKVLAFALAVLLWIVVSAEQVTSNWVRLPLLVEVSDPDYRIGSSEIPENVEVLFTGPGRDLLRLAFSRPPLRLNLTEVEEPIQTLNLDPRMVQLPLQIAVNALEVRPATVQLELTRMETRQLPVGVRVSSELGNEWAVVDSIDVDPARITVTGPIELVRGLSAIPTEVVSLSSADTIFSRAVALDTTQLAGLELSATSVQIGGRIDRVVQRTIQGLRVDVGSGFATLPAEVDVILRGPAETVERIAPERFRVAVSIGEIPERIPPEGFNVPLRLAGSVTGVQTTLSPAVVRLFSGPMLDSIPASRGEPPADPAPSTSGQDGG
jgi:hypothetical protein